MNPAHVPWNTGKIKPSLFFMLASAAPFVISLALYCTRDRWVTSLGRLLSLSPEASSSDLNGMSRTHT
jgi:hypothetical protein